MKMVIAFVQPFMASHIVDALHQVPGVTGATFGSVQGFGRGRHGSALENEELYGTTPRLRIEVAVPDELEEAVVSAIAGTARTGHRGDGKIYVVQLTRAVRISTGEEGTHGV